ncbi:MAG TPA: sugar phosphate nucleotidyltransferase [Candidatus Brocadiia bacterium]|nr:sugar phosphate nucleotidyltransferase [Candidatus Brocadiia bacterium]
MTELELFVPGRVCLFGEHSDWAGSYSRFNKDIPPGRVILTGTNQGIFARVKPHPDSLVMRSVLPDGTQAGPISIPMETRGLLKEAEKGGFFSYCAGVAYEIATHYHVKGLEIDCYRMDLPIKKGLSSSAAICVLAARAFNKIYDLKMTVRGEMEIAYRGEIATPSRCGRMDQGCAYGSVPIQMTFNGDQISVQELHVGADFHYLIVDLHGAKDTVRILQDLNSCYPFPSDDKDRRVQEYLGPINLDIVREARQAITDGDAKTLGSVMTRAQKLFDEHVAPACPTELTSPKLHQVLECGAIQPFIHGGKGVGSQGDGCAQLLCRGPEERKTVEELLNREFGMTCFNLDISRDKVIRKAVIPAAGFGTRMFPASLAAKKELFPIITPDGIAKPIILMILEEAINSGIEQVCVIVRKDDIAFFESFLHEPMPIEHYNRLPQHLKRYAQYLQGIGKQVTFVAQETQEGFGHAVNCARDWVGNEPFLLMLGDHLYRSDTGQHCAAQLLEKYTETRSSILSVHRTPEHLIGHFGTVAGEWIDAERTMLSVEEIAEKPTVDYARNNLRVEGLPEGEYLCVFGEYVLKPEVFGIIGDHIRAGERQAGEFQLTTALDRLRKEQGLLAYAVKGRRFDTGEPNAYLETLREFGNKPVVQKE